MRFSDCGFTDQLKLPASAHKAPVVFARVNEAEWLDVAASASRGEARFVSLWGSKVTGECLAMSAAYVLEDGILWVQLPLAKGDGYPDLSKKIPCTARMQRAVFELTGIRAVGAEDTRPWLNHGHWPEDCHPLFDWSTETLDLPARDEDYPFVRVQGDGVHEIAVGPIHAGVIEPGHFRFSVVGEKVLRLEERLGYAHRGIEHLFEGTPLLAGYRLAGRIAGDTTVAFSWAFSMAVEQALAREVPKRAQWLRAVLLERERIANHLGDLGTIGNDAGFAYGLAQFSRLKEDWLRTNLRVFGHRHQMDMVVPGGVAQDLDSEMITALLTCCDQIDAQVRILEQIYEDQSGLQDRFSGTGVLSTSVAEHFGVCGLAGRASGRRIDIRVDCPTAPYDQIKLEMVSDKRGDVAARVATRFGEIYESIRLIQAMLADLPAGSTAAPMENGAQVSRGVGWVEGWRGNVLVALETTADGCISRCHCHDPSWQCWPALEHVIIGNIVPDFPLINKSFNLNYAGHDL